MSRYSSSPHFILRAWGDPAWSLSHCHSDRMGGSRHGVVSEKREQAPALDDSASSTSFADVVGSETWVTINISLDTAVHQSRNLERDCKNYVHSMTRAETTAKLACGARSTRSSFASTYTAEMEANEVCLGHGRRLRWRRTPPTRSSRSGESPRARPKHTE